MHFVQGGDTEQYRQGTVSDALYAITPTPLLRQRHMLLDQLQWNDSTKTTMHQRSKCGITLGANWGKTLT
jgi:hypothetical protein